MQILDSLVEGALMLSDEREANELIGMMMRYLATGEMPEGRTDAQRMCLVQVLPVLEKTRTKSVQGARGGRKSRKDGKRTDKRTGKRTASETVSETVSERVTEEEEEERSKTLTGFKENAPAFSTDAPQGFTPPALDEVRGYFGANCLRGDPDAFVDHYAALGWKQNGRDVYDWKPLARQWHRRQVGFDADARAQGRQTSTDVAEAAVWKPAETDDEALERIEAELAALEGAA